VKISNQIRFLKEKLAAARQRHDTVHAADIKRRMVQIYDAARRPSGPMARARG
jgi:hypothetical protein